MTKISELPNWPDYPLRALAELRRKENKEPNFGTPEKWDTRDAFNWRNTTEKFPFWNAVFIEEAQPPIPAASMEDLRRAGMLPEPETPRIDTAPPPPFYCVNSESTAGPCKKQYAECDVEEKAARKEFYCVNSDSLSESDPCGKQCVECDFAEKRHGKRKPSITTEQFFCNQESLVGIKCTRQCAGCQSIEGHNATPISLADYSDMEREGQAITSPDHYKVCEGLEVIDIIRSVLTPEQFKGYCLGNIIKYRMRAGKKTLTPMEDLGKAMMYEGWLKDMEGGEE